MAVQGRRAVRARRGRPPHAHARRSIRTRRCDAGGGGDEPRRSSLAQGFTYIINNANFPGGIQAVLHLLDTYGNTKVIANPHLAALDNQKATIKAGDKIPINQQSIVGGTTNVVHDDVAVHRHRRAAAGDAAHQRRRARHARRAGRGQRSRHRSPNPGDAPPINTRSVQTIVSVQSGQTMVMGGLIGETTGNTSKGLPLLSRIPIIGGLFGDQELKNNRTELVMFITPRVVENEVDMKGIDRRPAPADGADRRFVRRVHQGPVAPAAPTPGKP